ncbi:acyl-CoA ligase (AMP-forming), exosortase A system-associated [Microbacterium aurum]|uniref:acyl-CoA ligase (AMP-forming), exosortase A system-associated n=1 Tax=Microbacterium aurum TaxID=36805 RepID=UPI0028E3CB9C|nr:acyl-CoA ligase (AMP-forming), exosortase A system-associated [Microbacterium aurum]
MSIVVGFHDLLVRAAAGNPHAPALTYRDETVTYAALSAEVGSLAAHLSSRGLERGDRVAIYLEKRVETVAVMFATSAAGAVFVPINHVLKPSQVSHILGDSGATWLVTSPERLSQLSAALADTAVTDVLVVGDRPDIDGPRIHDWPSQGGPHARPVAAVDCDPVAILYTSGSTGRPKGVVLSHRNLVVGAESVSTYLGNSRDDVILSVLPLSFDAGLSQVTTAFAVGAHCILVNYLLPRDIPRLCAKHRVTGLTCVPPLWRQLMSVEWPAETAGHIRYWANTGGRMPMATLSSIRSTFTAATPYLMYGLTEAFRSTYLDPAEIDRHPDSIGKAIPDAEVLVLDPEGRRCAPGEPGELVHRGPLVALGYWNDPVRTAERFRLFPHEGQPWRAPERAVWSGDTVVADEDGFLYFVARADEMIKTSGYRVSPTEIEEAAYGTGLVYDAVAFGVDDADFGQRIVLVVAGPSDGGAELLGALRRALPLYMVPAVVECRDDLPRSPNGKFDRALIRQEAIV